MEDINYIMVTTWELHWDNLSKRWKNSTIFTFPFINDNISSGPWPEEASTLFIKLASDKKFEKSWIGKTKNFRKDSYNDKPAIRFEVADLKEIDCPEEFRQKPTGWYLNKSFTPLSYTAPTVQNSEDRLSPPFFKEMSNCDPFSFEMYCFQLLRLIGIHDIHKFPQDDNRGKADGFFLFKSLSVIYDATLESNYQKKKETQIENYINQLKKEKIAFGALSYTIKDTQRQGWIITRGRIVRHIQTEDDIKVKEIPYTKLIEVYEKRLHEEMGSDELWDLLKDLC